MKREDQYHFEVGGSSDDQDTAVSLTCLRCTEFHVWIELDESDRGPTLADLQDRADAHVETCAAVRR